MHLVSVVPLLALALSAQSPELRDTTLGALDPARALEEAATGALPAPPEQAVIETQTFGTITLDHRAHLARKTSCKSCHNPGPVGKLGRLAPKVAHGRCVSCHEKAERGPTACRECHVKPAPPEPQIVDASATLAVGADAGGAPPGAPATGGGTVVPVLTAQLEAELNAIRTNDIEQRVRNPFKRVLGVGFSVLGGAGRDVTSGPAVYMTTREGRVLLLYAIEHGATEGSGRTFGLIGAGLAQPVHGNWNVQALLVGGFDAMENPTSFAPNLGVRGGVEWLGRRMSVTLAGTVASDLTSNTNKFGQQTGGMTYSVSANVGYVISRD